MTSSSIFWRYFVSLVKFSYLPKFHVNIITGSGVMTIFFYKRLTRNPEIGNTPVWVLPNIWRLGGVRDTLARMSLIMKIARVIAFSVFELLRENITPPPPSLFPNFHPTKIRINLVILFRWFLTNSNISSFLETVFGLIYFLYISFFYQWIL